MKRFLPVAALAAALSLPAGAQCVMCYRTAHAQNNARAHVLDMGIVILGAPPFLILAGFIAFVFSRDKVGQDKQ
jgi:ABC-type methionine transport system permease subunit